jgi:Flp pilus assembly protein TadD
MVRHIRSSPEPWLWLMLLNDPDYRAQDLQPREREAGLPAAEHFIARGQRLLIEGQLERALRSLRLAVLLEPDSFEAHYALAAALSLAGQAEPAMRHWEECLRIDPQDPSAQRQLQRARLLGLLQGAP